MGTTRSKSVKERPAEDAIANRANELVSWFYRARRDLPWRRTRDAYAIWVSETMLQQTRVETVIPYYARFLAEFPTVEALAAAQLDDVLRLWSGLGYYRRARLLHAGARAVVERHGGHLPETAEALRSVPGIGPYTAGAVASIAHGEATPLVDGNVHRVLTRLRGDASAPAVARKAVWKLAEALVTASDDPRALNEGLMELGAVLCVPRNPRCDACPWEASCAAHAQGLEREIPARAEKRASPVEAYDAWVVFDRAHRVLMLRRREHLRFGGLWEPPLQQLGQGEVWPGVALRASLSPEGRGGFEHVLTHRRLAITVWCTNMGARVGAGSVLRPRVPSALVESYDEASWVSRDTLGARGISTLARRILAQAGVEPL